MSARIAGVLFDVAGTLLMPEDGETWVRGALAALGRAGDEAEVPQLVAQLEAAGRPGGPYPAAVPERVARAYASRDLDEAAHRAAYVALLSSVPLPDPRLAEALYERIRSSEGWVSYADALLVLDALRARGVRIGVVSNVGFDLRPVLAAHGVLERVDACVLSFEAGAVKPEPAIFTAACAAIGTTPEETLMVGDHPEADGGASAAGLQTLMLPMTPAGGTHGLEAVLALV
jgi:HAD superfamily hydrolase (TIGR01549 family)